MANKDSTLIPRAVRKGRAGRGPKRDKSTSEYSSGPTYDLKLAAPPSVEEPSAYLLAAAESPTRKTTQFTCSLHTRRQRISARPRPRYSSAPNESLRATSAQAIPC